MSKHPLEYESMDEREIDRLKALNAELVAALKHARPLVLQWCHYQGNTKALLDEYVSPIDAALKAAENAVDK